MTRPTTTGKAQDLITFTRSTTGTALAKISYGEELVTNGTFDNNIDGWTTGSNVTSSYYSGTAQLALGGEISWTYTNWFSQNVFETGKLYFVTFDATYVSGGSLQAGYGYDLGVTASSSGTYSFIVNPDIGAGSLAQREHLTFAGASGAVWRIDNVSVKEVSFDRPDGTLQLFNHPIDKPRIEYDAEGNCLGLLVEEARTNLVTQSEFASGFLNYHITLTRNQTASPDTNINAGSAVPTAVNTEHYLECVLSSPSSGTYTQSVFVKANGYSKVALTPVHIGADQGATSTARFDLTEGTSTQIGSAVPYISNLGNGWYRIAITYTATGTVTNHRFRVQVLSDSYGSVWQANGADGIYVYGAQLETGSFPTSYIPTSGSAVTRSADVASLAVSEFGYNQGQGTVFINCLITEQPDFNLRVIDGNSNTKRWMYVNAPDNDYGLKYYDGTNNPTLVSSGIPLNMKAAVAVTPTQVFGAANSSAVGSGAHNGTLLDISQFNFFATLNGHIKSVQYYPLRLSNAQLQALTV